MIEAFAELIPPQLLSRSGSVFYSGREAFSTSGALYVLGLNPGGDPEARASDTVENHTAAVLRSHASNWSSYRDESWDNKKAGTHGLAPRVLHVFDQLGLNPGNVPCSNLVFARSRREHDIGSELSSLADLCWPFHALVIERLKPRVILCFGKTAGKYVRNRFDANVLISESVEKNERHWRSQTFATSTGLKVIVGTHPSIADWTAPETDPTSLIREALR